MKYTKIGKVKVPMFVRIFNPAELKYDHFKIVDEKPVPITEEEYAVGVK